MCFTSASESDSTYRTTDLSQEGDSSSSSDDDDKGNNSSSGGGSSDGGSPSRRTTPHDDGCITAALEIKSKFSADLIQLAMRIRKDLGLYFAVRAGSQRWQRTIPAECVPSFL